MTEKTSMTAVYALNRPPGSTTAHLVLDDADRAMCGTLPGEPAAAVTCQGCASRWAYSTREGRAAMHAARREMIFTALGDAMHPGDRTRAAELFAAALFTQPPPLYERVAQMFEQDQQHD